MTRLAMAYDLDRCIGCWACAVACKSENSIGEGLWWQQVDTVGGPERDSSSGEFPAVEKHYRPRNCHHCDNAPCMPACPAGAIKQRADGIVEIDYESCTGCGDCIAACPYDAIAFNSTAPRLPHGLEEGHGAGEVQPRRAAVAEKCTFCAHRVDDGREPACVAACPTGAIAFGDREDPQSEVAQWIERAGATRQAPQAGAVPAAWYLPYTIGGRQRRSGGREGG